MTDFHSPPGRVLTLHALERFERPSPHAGRSPDDDALAKLLDWVTDFSPKAPAFLALLGEIGSGKSTLLQATTRLLLVERERRRELPLPLYVDLRGASLGIASHHLSFEHLLPPDVLRTFREGHTVLFLDGLDALLVSLSPDPARALLRTLDPLLAETVSSTPGPLRAKVLVSCRPHVFRDVWEQNALLVGEGRERQRLTALCLRPLTDKHIRQALTSRLGAEHLGSQAVDLLASVHGLSDLARRPSLLSFLTGQLGALAECRARGEPVNTAQVYADVVRFWLEREDVGPGAEPTLRCMEALAAALWCAEGREWDAERLDAWLGATHPEEDPVRLRTRTFVLRDPLDPKAFRFAHASLHEYFLAAYLVRAIAEDRPERWDLPPLTKGALDFVGDLLRRSPLPTAPRFLESLLEGERPRAALIAFAGWLRALERGDAVPSPARVRLAGADLEGWHLRGARASEPLKLRGADLSGARLNRARLEFVDLADADLTGVQARQSLWLHVDAPRVEARGGDWRGLRWRHGSLEGARLRDTRLDGCQWIHVRRTGARLPDDWEHRVASVEERPPRPPLPETAAPLSVLEAHVTWVKACAWSPEGQRFVSGDANATLKIWDAASATLLLTLVGHRWRVSGAGHPLGVNACAWSPDGQRLLSGGADRTLKVWDTTSGVCLLTLVGHTDEVNACAWSPDGRRLVSGASDSTLRVWDAASGACLLTLTGHEGGVSTCAWSPDGQRLLSASAGGVIAFPSDSDTSSVKLWDATSGACLRTLSEGTDWILACAWSPDGQRVVSGSFGDLKVWDAASGQLLHTLTDPSVDGGWITACAWSPDGQRLLTASTDHLLQVWDAPSATHLRTLRGHSNAAQACAWSPEGQRILSASDDDSLRVWDATSGECLFTLAQPPTAVTACAWSPDGQRLASATLGEALHVWDAVTGARLLTLAGPEAGIQQVAWSPDGQRLLTGSPHGLVVWDVASSTRLLTLSGPSTHSWLDTCAWSPDSQRLLSSGREGTLVVWDATSGTRRLTLPRHSEYAHVESRAWSPDGRRLVSGGSDATWKVWDAESGACLLTRAENDGKAKVRVCAWSPDGLRVLTASETFVRVWDAATGTCLLTWTGHADAVQDCAWSPDGRRLLSASRDMTLKVWDAASGACLLTLVGHTLGVDTCAWSPDGQRVVSGSRDATFRVWDATSGQCLWSGHALPERQAVSFEGHAGRLLHASDEAWRWLGWRWTDPATGRMRMLPAEAGIEIIKQSSKSS